MTRTSLVVLLAAALAATTGRDVSAQPAYEYDRELGEIARKSLRHAVSEAPRPALGNIRRVYVRCYRDGRSFETTFERRFGVPAGRVIAYYAGGPDLHLRGATCEHVRRFVSGRHTLLTAASYSVLLHETLHRQGLRDERITNCLANEAVHWGAAWLGFDEVRALRARNLAFEFSRHYSPPRYRMGKPSCLALARGIDWPEFVP